LNRHLIFKLLAINLVVIGFVVAVVWFAIDTLAAGYFVTLMEKYHISPEPAHDMFVSAVHRYLIWSCLAAMVLAVLLSFVMLQRALAPLTRMTVTTREIAAGDFSTRVPAGSKNEVGQLARAFNTMAASLEKIEKLRRTLMIDVAHELRTPLTNIRGYLEALNDEVVPPSPQLFALLQDETLRLAKLVEDVLQLAKADAVQGQLALEPMDLVAALDNALVPFARALAQKEVALSVHTDTVPMVSADADKISRVLRNLADNAVRYTPAGGDLAVRITPMAAQVKVVFSNSARDVVAEDLPYLFERFYRGEKSRSRQHGGAGIGLAIVKELVGAHGGMVGAELVGDRFEIWFTLPAHFPSKYPK
jgi:two-component system, OmpR family, sensor histidine kinase BaeS